MLAELVERLRPYRMVVVSGAQRSGTHIMAKILAHELGWIYTPDTEYDTSSTGEWAKHVLSSHHITLHCPHMTHMLHLVPDDVAVVYMYRPADEIEVSFCRVNSGYTSCINSEQLLFYSKIPGVAGLQTGAEWTAVRNVYWEGYQRLILTNRGFSYNYHDLESHELFVPKEDRENWTMNQTERRV